MYYGGAGSWSLQWCGETATSLAFAIECQSLSANQLLQSGAELTFCLLIMEVSNPFLHGRFLLKVQQPSYANLHSCEASGLSGVNPEF